MNGRRSCVPCPRNSGIGRHCVMVGRCVMSSPMRSVMRRPRLTVAGRFVRGGLRLSGANAVALRERGAGAVGRAHRRTRTQSSAARSYPNVRQPHRTARRWSTIRTSGARSVCLVRFRRSAWFQPEFRGRTAVAAYPRIRGLRMTATDIDWSAGRGPVVSGPRKVCSWRSRVGVPITTISPDLARPRSYLVSGESLRLLWVPESGTHSNLDVGLVSVGPGSPVGRCPPGACRIRSRGRRRGGRRRRRRPPRRVRSAPVVRLPGPVPSIRRPAARVAGRRRSQPGQFGEFAAHPVRWVSSTGYVPRARFTSASNAATDSGSRVMARSTSRAITLPEPSHTAITGCSR